MQLEGDNGIALNLTGARLCALVAAYQRQASSGEAETAADRALRERVAAALVRLATDLAVAKFGGALAQLGTEAADVGGEAGARAFASLLRLVLTGRLEEDGPRLRAWVARHVEWTVRGLARRHRRPQEWWWRATREECWTRYAPLWEQYFLALPPELAAPAWRDLRRRFFQSSCRDFLRASLPGAAPQIREVIRLARADVRAWVGAVVVSLTDTAGAGEEDAATLVDPSAEGDPEARLLRDELRRLVRACLNRLEERSPRFGRLDRRLLELRYLDQRRLAEIAEIVRREGLGRLSSEAAVCRRLRRAEGRLRALLLEAGVLERAARPGAEIVLPEEIPLLLPSGLPLPRGIGLLPGADCMSRADVVAAAYGLLPRDLAAGWEAHARTCRFCASRLGARPLPGRVITWPAARALPAPEWRALWSQVLCLPPEHPGSCCSHADETPVAWLEPPAVDAYRRLVLRAAVRPELAGMYVRLHLSLTDERLLELPETQVRMDGSFSLRAACGLSPGVRVDMTVLRIEFSQSGSSGSCPPVSQAPHGETCRPGASLVTATAP
ncbi:MAG: hypothetical protein HY320_05185 [Armatimonadetes bacterium]|nr:hypothetical protein [Armatimonadota bacterium]